MAALTETRPTPSGYRLLELLDASGCDVVVTRPFGAADGVLVLVRGPGFELRASGASVAEVAPAVYELAVRRLREER